MLRRLKQLPRRKMKANAWFKMGKYAKASKRHDKAAKYIEHDSSFSKEEKKQSM